MTETMARMVKYSEDELIQAWRETHGLASAEGAIQSAGEDHLEAMLRQRLQSWYSRLLRTAPPQRLPQRDMRDKVREGILTASGALMLRLPREGSQLVEVKLPEWDEPVRTFYEPGEAAAARQRDHWRRSTCRDPVVILNEEIIIIYGLDLPEYPSPNSLDPAKVAADPAARLEWLRMTAWPEDGSYEFDVEDFPELNLWQDFPELNL